MYAYVCVMRACVCDACLCVLCVMHVCVLCVCTCAYVCACCVVGTHKDQFVDSLMKTYTSEAVFLLTTLVNMVRARSCNSHSGSCDLKAEQAFINTVTLEIFEVNVHVSET